MSETQFAMVSDWMVNGNIDIFVKTHPNVNWIELVNGSSRVLLSLLQAHDDLSS